MLVLYYQTLAGRRPAKEFIDALSKREAARVVADLDMIAEYDREIEACRNRMKDLKARLK